MSEEDRFPTGGALDLYASATAAGDRTDESFIGRELGDYRVSGLIARGGMGRVFRADRVDGSFEREAAIKVSPGSSLSSDLRDRFLLARALLLSGQQAAGEEQMSEALQIFSEHPAVDPHMAATVAAWRRRGRD